MTATASRRLWKALRHETPGPEVTAPRLGVPTGSQFAASVIRTYPHGAFRQDVDRAHLARPA
jgi:hypothetical protein